MKFLEKTKYYILNQNQIFRSIKAFTQRDV